MYIRVHVVTDVKKEGIASKKDGVLVVSVSEPKQQNRANTRVCQLIAEKYGILEKEVRIISGHHHTTKLLSLPDRVDALSLEKSD